MHNKDAKSHMINNLTNTYTTILRKISSLLVRVKYPAVPLAYKYFYRDTYVCRMVQLKYFFRDYIFKKKYKTVKYEGEFAAEIQFALPHAYWHFKNGTLKQTLSFPGTKELYFFSPDHKECFNERTNEGNYNYDIPRIVYSQNYNMKKWMAVPLKEKYTNDVYVFEKPILIIANKYNTEWDRPPISFFSIDVLNSLINQLKNKYTIIYNRPQPKNIVSDNSIIYDLEEFEWLKQTHPDVILLEDLYIENKIQADNFNHFQLCVYANCNHFISIHGGTATLASYFGGKNIILSKEGPEHFFKCYEKLYPQLSSAEIYHAKTDDDLFLLVKTHL